MKITLCFLGLIFFVNLHAQKLVKKTFVDDRTTSIQINTKYCYRIDLSTSQTNEVLVEADMEGEYAKDLLVNIEKKGSTVVISTGFQPNFNAPNDKLSAHKVISIKLNISLPENKTVLVYGTNTNVEAGGRYGNLTIKLSDGRCVLNNVMETVEVNTQKGDILLNAKNGIVEAESTYGKVLGDKLPVGNGKYVLKSVQGNIKLRKTK